MQHRILAYEEISVSKSEIFQVMGYGDQTPDPVVMGYIDEVLADARSICRPQIMWQVVDARQLSRGKIEMGETEFTTGAIIGDYLSGMSKACLFVATVGKEYADYLLSLKNDNIVKEYVADSVGSVLAEAGIAIIQQDLAKMEGFNQTLPYSPGYCGWNIKEQVKLFSKFPQDPCGIHLSDSFLMYPIKSVSGFIGLGETLVHMPYKCDICTNKLCYKRKHLYQ